MFSKRIFACKRPLEVHGSVQTPTGAVVLCDVGGAIVMCDVGGAIVMCDEEGGDGWNVIVVSINIAAIAIYDAGHAIPYVAT